LHQLRGELDRARELETEFAGRLHELHRDVHSRVRDRQGDAEAAAAIESVLNPLPAARRDVDDAHQRAETARCLIDAARDQRRPRGR
jgi:hypothetical protein